MEGSAQANTTHCLLLPSLEGSGKKIKSGYFITKPHTDLQLEWIFFPLDLL
jgi:hypothetical protein